MATTKNNSNTGNERYMAYIGSYTHGKCKGITILDVDNEAGRLTKRTEVPINNASYLAVSNSGKYLYSICDEGLAAFLILPNGNINLINQELEGMDSFNTFDFLAPGLIVFSILIISKNPMHL